jgi:hypothetical protein
MVMVQFGRNIFLNAIKKITQYIKPTIFRLNKEGWKTKISSFENFSARGCHNEEKTIEPFKLLIKDSKLLIKDNIEADDIEVDDYCRC